MAVLKLSSDASGTKKDDSTDSHQKRFVIFDEVVMAKRRNLKKEKAERNKAYARKFRKSSSKRFSSRRFNRQQKEEVESTEENN
ncbi:MAG: hypothetical protein ACFB4I_16180 [Cyanophyceae cyanobacterium]